MKYMKFNTMENLTNRIAFSVLEECEYSIKDTIVWTILSFGQF